MINKIITTSLCLLITASVAIAGVSQTANKADTTKSHRTNSISPQKASEIKALITSSHDAAIKIMSDSTISPEIKRARYRQLMIERGTKIDSITGLKSKRTYLPNQSANK